MGTMRKLRRKSSKEQYEVESLYPDLPVGHRKMSEVLLDFAQPLLDTVDDDIAFETAISFAAICWNASFLPEKEKHKMLLKIVDEIGKSDALTRLEVEDCAKMLLERKKDLFADDRRMILKYKVVEEGDNQRLLVMSTLAKD